MKAYKKYVSLYSFACFVLPLMASDPYQKTLHNPYVSVEHFFTRVFPTRAYALHDLPRTLTPLLEALAEGLKTDAPAAYATKVITSFTQRIYSANYVHPKAIIHFLRYGKELIESYLKIAIKNDTALLQATLSDTKTLTAAQQAREIQALLPSLNEPLLVQAIEELLTALCTRALWYGDDEVKSFWQSATIMGDYILLWVEDGLIKSQSVNTILWAFLSQWSIYLYHHGLNLGSLWLQDFTQYGPSMRWLLYPENESCMPSKYEYIRDYIMKMLILVDV